MTAEPRRRSSCAVWITVALVLLALAYALSRGPMMWLAARGALGTEPNQWTVPLYAPLYWLQTQISAIQSALDPWERWWWSHLR